MLRGGKVGLRARIEADVAILRAELYDDVTIANRTHSQAWSPVSPTVDGPFSVDRPSDTHMRFSVVELATDELLGNAGLWGIDLFNRFAHIGISLRAGARGRGFATDVIRTLCHYGFVTRGLHRLQVDTLADNEPMIRTALRCGFVREGTTRGSAWLEGEFVDEVILGMLDTEWRAAQLAAGIAGPGPDPA
jgi:RimJ/RimL family protein N-acetyltransferase